MRLVDPDALRRFRLSNLDEPCELCERRPGTDPHHVQFRSQGGDDTPENLLWLCRLCHDGIHDGRLDRYFGG
jgi:HNH endonuclease